jgi:hypothetical protein
MVEKERGRPRCARMRILSTGISAVCSEFFPAIQTPESSASTASSVSCFWLRPGRMEVTKKEEDPGVPRMRILSTEISAVCGEFSPAAQTPESSASTVSSVSCFWLRPGRAVFYKNCPSTSKCSESDTQNLSFNVRLCFGEMEIQDRMSACRFGLPLQHFQRRQKPLHRMIRAWSPRI